MLLDMMAAILPGVTMKQRRERKEGIEKARAAGKYRGRNSQVLLMVAVNR